MLDSEGGTGYRRARTRAGNAALAAVAALGQSIWLDDLSRDLLDTGALSGLVEEGVTGITTNPTIFEHSITSSRAYDPAVDRARADGRGEALEVYEALVVDDVRRAADLLHPAYQRTGGSDGFVSLEVRPALSFDGDATFDEACRLRARVARPNLMIKLPATSEGIAAIPRLVVAGVNVNATLIFSPATYVRVAEAYMEGLEARLAAGLEIASIAGVASFFVSRIDACVDGLLAKPGSPDATIERLRGGAALALSTLAYDAYRHVLSSSRWSRLAGLGARPQRLLWASMATKDPADPPTRYVRNLVCSGTVSTLPLETYRVFRSEALPIAALRPDPDRAREHLASLMTAGIDMDAVSEKLLADGLERFARSFDRLLHAVQGKLDAPRTSSLR